MEQETLETITSEYRFPIVESNQTNFVPRRQMPDDTLRPLPPSATLVETLIEPNTPLSPQPQPSIFQYQPPEQPLEPELTVEMFNYSMQSRTIVDPPEHLSSQGGNLLKVVP